MTTVEENRVGVTLPKKSPMKWLTQSIAELFCCMLLSQAVSDTDMYLTKEAEITFEEGIPLTVFWMADIEA
jgi:hypothetical protein|tara:strand:- start:709 stop:921 length:213 start_codon:yes stop_codon:yes gene_type:complete